MPNKICINTKKRPLARQDLLLHGMAPELESIAYAIRSSIRKEKGTWTDSNLAQY